jgi:type I restriction enzyme, S subunit
VEAAVAANLKRAFEGKLVPQDPSDEPASVLLERIKDREGLDGKKGVRQERIPGL